jgi:hypothetical protein
MSTGTLPVNNVNSIKEISIQLTDKEFEILKLELGFIEQRIIHLENLQYRLRQFSMALWTLTLGAGFGVTRQENRNFFLISLSGSVPILFLFLDAWYARAAQRFRSRKNRIASILNANRSSRVGVQDCSSTEVRTNGMSRDFLLLDLTDRKTSGSDSHGLFRESIWVKMTRTARLVFSDFKYWVH